MRHKRIKWLDFAKGITIFCVVLWHSISFISMHYMPLIMYLISTFMMPVFFAISGYLYKPTRSIHDYILLAYKKIFGFIIPYLFFTVLIFYFNRFRLLTHGLGEHSQLSLLTMILTPVTYLWFLYALMLIFFVVGIIDLFHVNKSIQMILCVVITIICIYLVHISKNNSFTYCLSYIIWFYFGYYIRYIYIHNQLMNKFINKCKKYNIFILLLVIFLVFQINITGVYNYNNSNTIKNIVTKLLSVLVLFSVFKSINNNFIFKYFDKYGKFTLIIYLVHFPILLLVGKCINIFNIMPLIKLIIIMGCTWYLSIFICYLCWHSKILKFIFYPRKYIDKWIINTKFGDYLFRK